MVNVLLLLLLLALPLLSGAAYRVVATRPTDLAAAAMSTCGEDQYSKKGSPAGSAGGTIR